ncbi:MAG: hypothetical protein DMG13_11550 [Acidobacteria bacterium]|nr:MAG: hypothetical protein DMG13_11550 [Acidobacteriota bacterium]
MIVSWVISSFALSFGFCLLLTPLFRNLALRWSCVDRPDFGRKIHRVPVPRVGGVPIVLACTGSFATLFLLGSRGTLAFDQSLSVAWMVWPASVFVFIIGLIDDLIGLKAIQKLGGQILAAVLLCVGGLRFTIFGDGGWGCALGGAVTVVWLVACTNAFNLIDGIDGLAAGLGLIAALTALSVAVLDGDVGFRVVAAIVAGSLLGFLRFNFSPASIFLGDSGSLWIGFVLGCFGVIWVQESTAVLGFFAPAVAFSIPLLDTTLSFARRFVARRPIFTADRGHVHHRLIERGFTPCRVALLLYAASALVSCFSLMLSVDSGIIQSITIVVFCAAASIAIQCLRYKEFGTFAYLLSRVRSNVDSQISLHAFEERFRNAASPEECWSALRNVGREFGFTDSTLQLGGDRFEERSNTNGDASWYLYVPLSTSDYVSLTRPCGSLTAADTVTRLADLLHRTLSEKSAAFHVIPERDRSSTIAQSTGSKEPAILQPEIQRW